MDDPIPDEALARLWALLMEGPDAIRRLLQRPRLARHPRRLWLSRRAGVMVWPVTDDADRRQ